MDPWNQTEAFVAKYSSNGNHPYFDQMVRAIVEFGGCSYPCWIGPKANNPHCSGAILIVKKGENPPVGNPNTEIQRIDQDDDCNYTCWQFCNRGDANNEGYGEMRRYLWNRRDELATITIIQEDKIVLTGADISAGNIVNSLPQ